MTNKLNPQDIIDGLDCCAIENCHECPYRLYFECQQILAHDAVEFIRKHMEVNDGYTET